MDPLSASLISSAILGGASGLTSYFKGKAEEDLLGRRAQQEAAGQYLGLKRSAIQENVEKQQSALQDIINAYRSTIG